MTPVRNTYVISFLFCPCADSLTVLVQQDKDSTSMKEEAELASMSEELQRFKMFDGKIAS